MALETHSFVIASALLLFCLFSTPSAEAVEVFLRAGDAPQNGEIYRNKETGLFVDARSLPHTYRSRITRNNQVFESVDMEAVAAGRSTSTTDVLSYAQPWHATSDEDLVHDTQAKRYLVISTLPDSLKGEIESNPRFKPVKTPTLAAFADDPQGVQKHMLSALDKALGIASKDHVIAQHAALSEHYAAYLDEKDEAQADVLEELDDEIAKQTRRGKLEAVKQWQGWRSAYLAGRLAADQVDDRKLTKKLKRSTKDINAAYEDLMDEVKEVIEDLVRDGRIADATQLKNWIKDNSPEEDAGDQRSGVANTCAVMLSYKGNATVDTLTDNMVYLLNRGYTLGVIPVHLKGLKFTKLQGHDVHPVALTAYRAGKCYLLLDARHSGGVIAAITKDGWTADGSIVANDPMGSFQVYSKQLKKREVVDIPQTSGGWISAAVAASDIKLK